MSIVYGLRLTCDLYLYYTVLALLGIADGRHAAVLALPTLLGVGAGIGYRNAGRGERARLLPLALGLLAGLLRPTNGEWTLAVPAAVYAVMYVRRNRRATDYYYAFERLKFSMIPLGAALLMMALGGSGGFGAAVPALFVYLALSVSLLRMLRHEAAVIAQRRFQALNLAGLAGVCLLGLALSTDRVLRALRAGAEWVGRYVLLPIAWAVWKVVEWVLSGVNWLLSKISFGENPVELDLSGMQSMGGDEQIGMTEMEQFAANPALQQALKIVGILALCVAGFFLMRALSKHAQRGAEAERREERERLDEPLSPGGGLKTAIQRRGDPVWSVRRQYARFLRRAEGRGVLLNGRQNSRQVLELAREKEFDSDAMEALREVYVRARYDADADAQSVRQARAALEKLK